MADRLGEVLFGEELASELHLVHGRTRRAEDIEEDIPLVYAVNSDNCRKDRPSNGAEPGAVPRTIRCRWPLLTDRQYRSESCLTIFRTAGSASSRAVSPGVPVSTQSGSRPAARPMPAEMALYPPTQQSAASYIIDKL